MKHFIRVLAIAALVLPALAAAQEKEIVIRASRVLDGKGNVLHDTRIVVQGSKIVHIERWGSEEKLFTMDTPQPATAALRLMNYPAWRVEINGRVARAESHYDSGQMLIPLPAGSSRVRVHFAPPWDRLAGALISTMAGASLLVLALQRRSRVSDGRAPGGAHRTLQPCRSRPRRCS